MNTQEAADFYEAVKDLGKKKGLTLTAAFLDGTDQVKEGDWRDSNGNKITYFNWADAQPDNANGNEHFLHIHPSFDGKWNDATADRKSFIICQRDPIGKYLEVTVECQDSGCRYSGLLKSRPKTFFDGKFLTIYIFTFSVNRTFFFLA